VVRTRDGRKIRKDVWLEGEGMKVTSRHYQKLIRRVEGRPEERIVNYLMLRSLKQARYSEENAGHFALAAPAYTHFTSPIRRYPDLVVHRILGAWLDERPAPFDAVRLAAIARESSETERRAAEAERELVEWKKINFMAERVGDEFPALIISDGQIRLFRRTRRAFRRGACAHRLAARGALELPGKRAQDRGRAQPPGVQDRRPRPRPPRPRRWRRTPPVFLGGRTGAGPAQAGEEAPLRPPARLMSPPRPDA
jgi:hypothetical protein